MAGEFNPELSMPGKTGTSNSSGALEVFRSCDAGEEVKGIVGFNATGKPEIQEDGLIGFDDRGRPALSGYVDVGLYEPRVFMSIAGSVGSIAMGDRLVEQPDDKLGDWKLAGMTTDEKPNR